jgi:hypothetical protein
MPKNKRPLVEIPLKIPERHNVDSWVVFGLDPSLSRTGHALLFVESLANYSVPIEKLTAPWSDHSVARWINVGSAKPGETSDPVWVRSKLISLYLRDAIRELVERESHTWNGKVGLILSLEFPTPLNDFLTSLSRVLHITLLEEISHFPPTSTGAQPFEFAEIHILQTNASTLRSLMGLTKKGDKNKVENQVKAHEYLDDPKAFPQLDTDACDAVLLAVMGRFAASILLGLENEVPQRFKQCLTSSEVVVKGKGRNQRTEIKGLLWNKRYWYTYTPKNYGIMLKDARSPKLKLNRREYTI